MIRERDRGEQTLAVGGTSGELGAAVVSSISFLFGVLPYTYIASSSSILLLLLLG